MATGGINNDRLHRLIMELADRHRAHDIFTYIRDGIRLPLERRFSQLNKFVVFSVIFSDMMDLIARQYGSNPDDLSAAIVEHAKDDMHHFRLLISDYKERMKIDSIMLDDVEQVLFAKEHLFMRTYAYEMMQICFRVMDNPVLLVCFLEAIEGSSYAMISGYHPALKDYQAHSGLNLRYFGTTHLEIEESHERLLDKIHVSDEIFAVCDAIVREHFENAWRMLDASLECTYDYEEAVLAKTAAG